MAETEDKPAPEPENPTETKKVELTQDDLDKIVGKVRLEEKARHEKEAAKIKEDYEKTIKLSQMKEEERVKAEAEMKYKALSDELSTTKRVLALKAAEADLAKLGLDSGFAEVILGADDESTAKNIATLQKQIDTMVKAKLDSKIKTGAPSAGGPGGQGSDLGYSNLRRMGYTDAQAKEYLEKTKA